MRSRKELVEMVDRIPDYDLGMAIKRYLRQREDVDANWLASFLEFYVKAETQG